MTEEKGTFEPIMWVGVAFQIVGIAYAWLSLILFKDELWMAWLQNDIYRYLAFIPAFIGLLPFMNAIRLRQPTCLRNSAIFMSLTLILPTILLVWLAQAFYYRRGIAKTVELDEPEMKGIKIDYSFARNCDTGSFNAHPKTTMKIDIEKVLPALKIKGYKEISNAMVKCIVEKDGVEITMNFHGDVIVKTEDEELAGRLIDDVYRIIGWTLA